MFHVFLSLLPLLYIGSVVSVLSSFRQDCLNTRKLYSDLVAQTLKHITSGKYQVSYLGRVESLILNPDTTFIYDIAVWVIGES